MTLKIRYYRGDSEIGEPECAETLEDARRLVEAKVADLDHQADIVMVFRISPSGTEELEESRRLHT